MNRLLQQGNATKKEYMYTKSGLISKTYRNNYYRLVQERVY